jgi:hypothetical protein
MHVSVCLAGFVDDLRKVIDESRFDRISAIEWEGRREVAYGIYLPWKKTAPYRNGYAWLFVKRFLRHSSFPCCPTCPYVCPYLRVHV